MSLSGSIHMTLLDLQKTLAPDGSVMEVAQVLDQMNDGIMSSVNFIEGNEENGHRFVVQSSLPTTSLGALNKGVVASKGSTVQFTETCGKIETLSEISEHILKKSSNPALTRQQKDATHVESMHQDFLYYLWYGDTDKDPLAFNGFTKRYNDPTAANGANIINGGAGLNITGRTDLQSIWIINFGPSTITGLIPKRTTPGLVVEDWGKYMLESDGSDPNARIHVYGTYFAMHVGLAVIDWRHAVRIANIPLGLVTPDASTGPNLPYILKEAMERLWRQDGARIYMTRSMRVRLGQQIAAGVDSSTLKIEEVGGISASRVTTFDGVPVFRTDSLRYSTVKPTAAQYNPTAYYTGEPMVVFP